MSSGTPSGASDSLVPPPTTTPTIGPPSCCVRPRSGVRPSVSLTPSDPPHQPQHEECPAVYQGRRRWQETPENFFALLVGDLASGQHLDVGDQLTHRGTGLTPVAAELALELDTTPVTERAVTQLKMGTLHL